VRLEYLNMSGAQLLRKPRHRTPSALLRAAFIGWLLTWSMVLSGHAAAEEHWERNRRFYATVYGDIWAHTNLYSLPLEAAQRDVRTAEAYFVGVGLGYALIPSFSVPLLFCECRVEGLSLELEGKFGRHFGLQDHSESVLVLMLRSPQLQLLGGFSINWALGEGVSYAHSLPKFEGSVAAEGSKASGPRQFLNYLAYEVELTHERLKNWHFVLNVHHRSGIWGVIAPQRTGANYIGGGIRFDF
jgi:hypothetical protein